MEDRLTTEDVAKLIASYSIEERGEILSALTSQLTTREVTNILKSFSEPKRREVFQQIYTDKTGEIPNLDRLQELSNLIERNFSVSDRNSILSWIFNKDERRQMLSVLGVHSLMMSNLWDMSENYYYHLNNVIFFDWIWQHLIREHLAGAEVHPAFLRFAYMVRDGVVWEDKIFSEKFGVSLENTKPDGVFISNELMMEFEMNAGPPVAGGWRRRDDFVKLWLHGRDEAEKARVGLAGPISGPWSGKSGMAGKYGPTSA